MLATHLPAPAERIDPVPRAAAPEPAAQRPADGRFADLLRQRRADAAQPTERAADAPQDGAVRRGRVTTATTTATSAAAARTRPDAGRAAREDDTQATRVDPESAAAGDEAPADAPAPVAADGHPAHEPAAPAVPGSDVVPIALPTQVDPAPSGGGAAEAAPGRPAGIRSARAQAKTGFDAADGAQDPAAVRGGVQDKAAPAAAAALPAAAEPHRGAPVARGADASLAAGAAMAPTRPAEVAPAAVPSVALPAPFASPEFGELLGAQVSLFARDGLQQAELRLNPAEMGPIGVQIEIDGNEARISFNAGQALTRDAIERALPELASALRGEGLTLAGGGVFDRPSSSRGGAASGRSGAGTRRGYVQPVAALPTGSLRGLAPQGAVDLYA